MTNARDETDNDGNVDWMVGGGGKWFGSNQVREDRNTVAFRLCDLGAAFRTECDRPSVGGKERQPACCLCLYNCDNVCNAWWQRMVSSLQTNDTPTRTPKPTPTPTSPHQTDKWYNLACLCARLLRLRALRRVNAPTLRQSRTCQAYCTLSLLVAVCANGGN